MRLALRRNQESPGFIRGECQTRPRNLRSLSDWDAKKCPAPQTALEAATYMYDWMNDANRAGVMQDAITL